MTDEEVALLIEAAERVADARLLIALAASLRDPDFARATRTLLARPQSLAALGALSADASPRRAANDL